MNLSIRTRAILELREAYWWYEARQAGLGEAFLRPVEACFVLLRREAEIYPLRYGVSRCAPLHRFPHCVCYVIRSDRVDIVAVYHGQRPPVRFDPEATLA